MGGHPVLSGANAYTLGRIAQNGTNYNNYTLYIRTPGVSACTQQGDFNCNGTVEGADLTLLLNNWAKPTSSSDTRLDRQSAANGSSDRRRRA